jgi:hypothetical protein
MSKDLKIWRIELGKSGGSRAGSPSQKTKEVVIGLFYLNNLFLCLLKAVEASVVLVKSSSPPLVLWGRGA